MKKHLSFPLILSFLAIMLLFSGCSGKQPPDSSSDTSTKTRPSDTLQSYESYPQYARLFSIEYKQHAKVVRLKNPFDTSRLLRTYLLLPRGVKPDTALPQGQIVRIPLQSVALAQTTHIGFFDELNVLPFIRAVSQKRYVKNPQVRRQIEKGNIDEFGPAHNINVEKLLQADPELLFVAPFRDNKYKKVSDVGIPMAINSSYMETTPLARAEWIKFVAYFFNREKQAEKTFDKISSRYHDLSRRAAQVHQRPTIFSGKKIGQVWYVPGGESYMARFFEDAGAHYLWGGNSESGSLPLDFETVYYKAEEADYWCIIENYQGDYDYKQLGSEHIHYKEFEAFKNKNVIFCNTHTQPYYEQGILEPHIILADLISILQPQVLPGHTNKYYKILEASR